jgi:uroporphyrinogen-III synthase
MIFCSKVINVSEANPLHVVVMRPEHQAEPLLQAISQLGFVPISLPTLTITPMIAEPNSVEQWCHVIDEAAMVIVSSQNAVLHAPTAVLTAC